MSSPNRPVSHGRRKDNIAQNSVVIPISQYTKLTQDLFEPIVDKNEIARQLHDKDKIAHEKSQARVDSWKNTLQATRKSRLHAAEVKAEQAEQARIQQDKEWHKIVSDEKEDFLRNAKLQQLFETPDVRALHSKLNIVRVLEERELQIKYKQKLNDHQSQITKDQYTDMMTNIAKGDQLELTKQKAAKKYALEFSHAQKDQARIKKETKDLIAMQEASIGEAVQLLVNDNHQDELLQQQKIHDKRTLLKEGFDIAVIEHQQRKIEEQNVVAERVSENEAFNSYKQIKEDFYKETLAHDVNMRTDRTRHVTAPTIQAITATVGKTDEFIKQWSNKKQMWDYNAEEDNLKQLFAQNRLKTVITANEQLQYKLHSQQMEADNTKRFINERNSKLNAMEQQETEKKQHISRVNRDYAKDHLERSHRKRIVSENAKYSELKKDIDNLDQLKRDNQQFLTYANKLIEEERMNNHEVQLLVQLVNHNQSISEGKVKTHGQGHENVMTWNRIFGGDTTTSIS